MQLTMDNVNTMENIKWRFQHGILSLWCSYTRYYQQHTNKFKNCTQIKINCTRNQWSITKKQSQFTGVSALSLKTQFTPKSQRKNPYIINDHFDPNINADSVENVNNKSLDDSYDSNDETSIITTQFPVRIHHLKRGFYFDTSFNDFDNEQIIKYKNGNNNEMNIKVRNHSYTALGAQFDENYDMTVNGVLLRIDETAFDDLDIYAFGKGLQFPNGIPTIFTQNVCDSFQMRDNPVAMDWFLYSKPKEFIKNMELEQETVQCFLDTNERKNELSVIYEENPRKYQLNVWTYIVPKEIMWWI